MPAGEAAVPTRPRQPRGFALPAAIFALVVIGALVTGGFFAARQEMRIGLNSRASLTAFTAAEAGVDATIAGWQAGTWNLLAVGDSATVSGSLGSGAGASTYAGSVRRLNTQLFLVRVTGQDRVGSAQRTLATLTRLRLVRMNLQAALTVRGATKLGGLAFLDGRDTNPVGWSSCPTTGLDTLAGLTLPDLSRLTYSGCDNQSCLAGEPKILADPVIGDSTFFQYGDLDWNELVAMATKVYPTGDIGPVSGVGPVGTTTTCATSILDNWGDPHHGASTMGCSNYFPIIYANGDLRLHGGYGQGILLVAGDLHVSGGAEFLGLVIARGSLRATGTGGRLIGGVMAANVDQDLGTDLGNAVIAYSSCALATAIQASALGRPVRERSWAEIF